MQMQKKLTTNKRVSRNKLDEKVLMNALTEFKNGNFTVRLPTHWTGEAGKIAQTFNETINIVNGITDELHRIGQEVGVEGKIMERMFLPFNVDGGWQDKIECVNRLITNMVQPIAEISRVISSVAKGDFKQTIPVSNTGVVLKGPFYDMAKTVNTMVEQLSSFAAEVTRVAREVGTEGKLGGQAEVKGVAGVWKDLTDNVNHMADNLTKQVRNIAEVTTAVANGDLTRKITVDVKGEMSDLKKTINTMVDQLNNFALEVLRVAREVGLEGKLGGKADVKFGAGVWKSLTENVNMLTSNLTSQVRNIAEVTTAVAMGNLSKKITVDVSGEFLLLKETINTMVDQLRAFASEVTRVAREVGTEGILGGQAYVIGTAGTWKDLTENVNHMASNLTNQVRNIAAVTTAVAKGDLSKKITVDAKGEILELKNTINIMVDQLNSFASEVTRVAREVGTEGKLGGQAVVDGVDGIWKNFTESVNQMASNLTEQVRSIAKVVTAVAEGDLKKKLKVQAKGEIAALSETINNMIDTLDTFADQVTSVSREVGVEGKLGGQACVPGASGTWKDLTDNVNQLAANLTNQVRAISEVATAVTTGDLTRTIRVEAQGEVAALKDIINKMIFNLKETTQKNAEQNWLKTNLAKLTRLLQGQKNVKSVASLILSELAPMVDVHQGVFFLRDESDNEYMLKMIASYAYTERKNLSSCYKVSEGLVGQCAYEKKRILLSNVPGDYIKITSGLGEIKPINILVMPILFEDEVKGVIELSTLYQFSQTQLALLDQLSEIIGIVLNSIETNTRTEELLIQSQRMAQELQSQQHVLKITNAEAKLLAKQNAEVAQKNNEVEIARCALEEKAEQLSLTSKYKSEFLANMSHELRTPLNSLLILSKHLSENMSGNLNAKQIEFANTIYSSGTDLLNLINDILDLTKIESGVASINIESVKVTDICGDLQRMFNPMATNKNLFFNIEVATNVPEDIETDVKRLQQILKNFLSNAFKFTQTGGVSLKISCDKTPKTLNPTISDSHVIGFHVIDSGIGIPLDKQQIIFEAFQQIDGAASRKYGGTGLGLSICRQIAYLLQGDISLYSEVNKGSTFSFYLPIKKTDNLNLTDNNTIKQLEKLDSNHIFNSDENTANGLIVNDLLVEDETNITQSAVISANNFTQDYNESVILFVSNDIRIEKSLLNYLHDESIKPIFVKNESDVISFCMHYNPDALIIDNL